MAGGLQGPRLTTLTTAVCTSCGAKLKKSIQGLSACFSCLLLVACFSVKSQTGFCMSKRLGQFLTTLLLLLLFDDPINLFIFHTEAFPIATSLLYMEIVLLSFYKHLCPSFTFVANIAYLIYCCTFLPTTEHLPTESQGSLKALPSHTTPQHPGNACLSWEHWMFEAWQSSFLPIHMMVWSQVLPSLHPVLSRTWPHWPCGTALLARSPPVLLPW